MVKIQGPSDYEKLDELVAKTAERHGLRLDVTGWTRKTYDVYQGNDRLDATQLIARVESFATTSGEIIVFDDSGMSFAEDLGAGLEREFESVLEAVVVRK